MDRKNPMRSQACTPCTRNDLSLSLRIYRQHTNFLKHKFDKFFLIFIKVFIDCIFSFSCSFNPLNWLDRPWINHCHWIGILLPPMTSTSFAMKLIQEFSTLLRWELLLPGRKIMSMPGRRNPMQLMLVANLSMKNQHSDMPFEHHVVWFRQRDITNGQHR